MEYVAWREGVMVGGEDYFNLGEVGAELERIG